MDFTIRRINNGGNDQNNPGIEANVDTQYAAAMSFPTPQIFYSTGGYDDLLPLADDPFLAWVNILLKEETNTPPTISISYGYPEYMIPTEYMDSLCDLFAKLGAIGVSVITSSGDDGVGKGDCLDKRGEFGFQPAFPGSCTCGD